MGILNISSSPSPANPRLGMHYFPDTLHYRAADLHAWLPELQSLGASWLVVLSEVQRAIPEYFLRGLKQAGIQPIIQFQIGLEKPPDLREIGTILEVYARWGARYVLFYDRPNAGSAWPASGWVQQDLVERFLDRFLPVANLALSVGLIPVFPALEPGGNYWDTAFLRSALEAIQRRKKEQLLQALVLSAYAWTGGHSLDWGTGGPSGWPQARPYITATDNQDQRGFRIYEWYQAIASDVLHQTVPILLLQAGLPGEPTSLQPGYMHSAESLGIQKSIAGLIAKESVIDPLDEEITLASMPSYLLACNFWLLSASPDSLFASQSWYSPQGDILEIVKWLKAMQIERQARLNLEKNLPGEGKHSIRHYLLLPGFEWGVSDWYLEIVRPFVKKHLPTVGFSAQEAEKAEAVTIVGNLQNYPEGMLSRLQNAGCKVDLINGSGTEIAIELAER